MLKCDINKENDRVTVEFCGSMEEIIGELLGLVRQVYRGFAEDDLAAAECFKDIVSGSIAAPDGGVWLLEEADG